MSKRDGYHLLLFVNRAVVVMEIVSVGQHWQEQKYAIAPHVISRLRRKRKG